MNPFDTSGFPARWFCGTAWSDQPWVGWLHIISDLVIFASYFAVPAVVMYFVRQRNDLRFPPIFYAFLGVIFLSCGTVHVIEAGIFWWPAYKLSAYAKFVTAAVSATGVFLLARVLPTALDLKSGTAYAEAVEARKQAQQMLEHEQFLLRTMMSNLPDLIYFKDRESRFTRVSDSLARFLGEKDPADVIGKDDFDYFPPDFAKVARADEVRLMDSGEALIGKEEPEHSAEGQHVWLSSTKLPLRNQAGEVIGMFGLSRDITPQKQAAAVLAEAKEAAEAGSRAKSDFLANMSHEIRTPMNSIMGMTELVLDTELSATQRDYLTIVYESSESLLTVINEILDFSKIEAGKLEFANEDIDLREEVADILKTLALRAHGKGLELAWRVDADVPDYVKADPLRLRQILVNLVGNAIKFTAAGEVLVEVKLDSETHSSARLQFVVTDTGIGIPETKRKAIFEAFEQADSSTTRQFGGTGLGLAITKRIVEALNGRLWVESEEGEGSQFHFILELARGESPPDDAPLANLDFSRVPVVVVDDNATNCRILAEMLESWQMKVRVAPDGPTAIQAIRDTLEHEGRMPLLISDVNMPDMDGFTLVEKLRADQQLRGILVMMLTSGGRSGDITRCEQLGVTAHMMKPVKQSELQHAIIRLAGRAPDAPHRREAAPVAPGSEIRPLDILLVEDGRANQKLAFALLEKWGHTVTLAEDGRQAVERWQAGSFDVILMDVQMPIMDGLTATGLIRKQERAAGKGGHIPVIAMTARAMKGDRERCLNAGMDDYVSKPIHQQALYDALRPFFSAPGSGSTTIEENQPPPTTATSRLIDWPTALASMNHDESILAVVVEAAIEEIEQLQPALIQAWTAGDLALVQRHAHTLKSTFRTLGATLVADHAAAIENAAAGGDLSGVESTRPEWEQLLSRCREELKSRLAEG